MLLTSIHSTLAAFSPPDLNTRPLPTSFDASTAKPPNMSWWEWCDPPGRDDMDVPLSNRSLKLMRDTPWLQLRAATLDALEFSVPRYAPALWAQGSKLLDVGAASGELTRFIARKYGIRATALDVAAPVNNSYAQYKQKLDAWPITLFNGWTLPQPTRSHDVVMFVMSLHHAGKNAPALLREAARVASSTIVIVEAVDTLPEAARNSDDAAARRAASSARAKEFPCMGDRKAIFRTQAEWIGLIEQQAGWRVTKVGAVRATNSDLEEAPSMNGGVQEDPAPRSAAEYHRWFVARRTSSSGGGKEDVAVELR